MVTMVGTNDKTKADRVVVQEDPTWKEIRNQLYRLCLVGFKDVIKIRENFPKVVLSGRSLGIWQGILTMAKLVDGETFQELLSYAKENKDNMEGDAEEFGDEPKKMLQMLLELCPDNKMVEKTPDELMEFFSTGFIFQFNITSKRDLSTRLGRFGMHTTVIYWEGTHMRVYRLFKNRIEDLIAKYK
jgi:hypothetical protein